MYQVNSLEYCHMFCVAFYMPDSKLVEVGRSYVGPQASIVVDQSGVQSWQSIKDARAGRHKTRFADRVGFNLKLVGTSWTTSHLRPYQSVPSA